MPLSALFVFARDIKVSHTIFAMPWAILSTLLAAQVVPGDLPLKLGLILLCMVAGRTLAMAANRLLDARLDALNPRTAGRAIPSGRLTSRLYVSIAAACAGVFVGAAALFLILLGNRWPLLLAAPVLVLLVAYPVLKRFTRLCHYYLGAALGLAPVCAWVAVTGAIDWPPVVMGGAVLLWTAGFDIIYACQDYASDLETGVSSVPASMGIARALWVSRLTHVVCLSLLVLLGMIEPRLGALYFVGVGLAGALLVVEHLLIGPGDLSKVGLAFFTINGIISLVVGTLGVIDVLR